MTLFFYSHILIIYWITICPYVSEKLSEKDEKLYFYEKNFLNNERIKILYVSIFKTSVCRIMNNPLFLFLTGFTCVIYIIAENSSKKRLKHFIIILLISFIKKFNTPHFLYTTH